MDTGREWQPSRRRFFQSGLAASVAMLGAAPIRAADPLKLDELTIAELQAGIAAGRYTARSLTAAYLDRIQSIDRSGPTLRSVLEVNPDALTIADALDAEHKAKGPRGPFHGVPVLIKDNIGTQDKMETTAGSLALVGARPAADSFLVKKLRQAGVVILGKTNLSEWANYRSNRSTSGWSARGGLTRNPYALDRNPSGSSSGSAVAAAANLCAVAVGTETDGSIISPATVCGVVGLKPTVGLISRAGVIPISHTQDTAGPMTRCVADAAVLLGVLAGPDPDDKATAQCPAIPDYAKSLDRDGLKGAKIGIVRRYFGFYEAVDSLMAKNLDAMKAAGATLVEIPAIDSMARLGQSESLVLNYEFKAGLNEYLAKLGSAAPVKSLKELIAFNDKNKTTEMPFFGQEIFTRAEARGPLTSQEYLDALERCRQLSRTDGIDAVMEKHKVDALVAPSGGPANATDLIFGNRGLGGCSGPAAVAGYPHITVPGGFVFGMPVGISFFGRAWSEPTLLRLTYAFEQLTMHRKPPRFLATVESP